MCIVMLCSYIEVEDKPGQIQAGTGWRAEECGGIGDVSWL